MTLLEAIESRHSVRSYTGKPLDGATIAALQQQIDRCNANGRLHIQLVTNEPQAFSCRMARYGKFSDQNVRNLAGYNKLNEGTDKVLAAIVDAGMKPFFRLGVTTSNNRSLL